MIGKDMKAVIFAGGLGTRLSEETNIKPKPMVELGERPILWHIMKFFSTYGVKEFIVLAGYKGEVIKKYFLSYFYLQQDLKISLKKNEIKILRNDSEDWIITILDTGQETMTGGRLLRAKEVIGNERFFLTYGDGLSDVNLNKLLDTHLNLSSLATVTAVRPKGRFGSLSFSGDYVTKFAEKIEDQKGWINGGFFVCEPGIFKYLEDDFTVFERDPLEKLALEKKLGHYKHNGFWQCMDTLNDKKNLVSLWVENRAPWKIW